MKTLLVVLTALALSACGITGHNQAAAAADTSLAAYKACLAQHQTDVNACEAARLTYEADLANLNRPRGVINN